MKDSGKMYTGFVGFGELVVLVAVVAAMALCFRAFLQRPNRREEEDVTGEDLPMSETEMLHELFRGLQRMEKRIEVLETLLLDQEEARRAPANEKQP